MAGRAANLTALGRIDEGIVHIRQSRTLADSLAPRLRRLYFVTLAEACLNAGLTEEGLTLIEHAISSDTRTVANRWGNSNQIKGELLLQRTPPDESGAEKCFRSGIELARQGQNKWNELRASTSLARLLAKQGKRDEARQTLAEIYPWFTEGFDAPDLQDAKALLEELKD
jgi:predicted ATPase